MSDSELHLSLTDHVQLLRFEDVAEALLEREGALSADLERYLHARADRLQVHPLDFKKTLEAALLRPAVLAALQARRKRAEAEEEWRGQETTYRERISELSAQLKAAELQVAELTQVRVQLEATLAQQAAGGAGYDSAMRSGVSDSAASASRPVLTVSASGNSQFRTITQAVRAAEEGAQVLVRPGTYCESIRLERPISLKADRAAGDVVVRCPDASCLTIRADRVNVHGFTLQPGTGRPSAAHPAIEITWGSVRLEACVLGTGFATGIAVRGKDVRCVRGTFAKCRVNEPVGAGVRVEGHAAVALEGCTIEKAGGPGVEVVRGGVLTAERCRILGGAGFGIFLNEGGGLTAVDLEVAANARAGVVIADAGQISIQRSRIVENMGPGIWAFGKGVSGQVRECDLRGNSHGPSNLAKGAHLSLSDNRT